jgi:hypothetical protein
MSQAIINYLNGYTLQDARVDSIDDISAVNTAANVINRTTGQQGIEVRNNRLVLTEGGYYGDAAVFEDVGNQYDLDNSIKTSYSYDVSGTSQDYLNWMAEGNQANVFIKGSNGRNEIEEELEGTFVVDGTEAGFELSDSNASLTDYGIQSIKVNLANMTFIIEKDTRNEDNLTLTEIATYLPDYPQVWPVDLVDIDGIYEAIRDRLIDEGYIQSQM